MGYLDYPGLQRYHGKVQDEIDELKDDFSDLMSELGYTESLFDAKTFTISNASNWQIIRKTKTSLVVDNLTGWSSGNPTAYLSIPSGTYVFLADFSSETYNYCTYYENGTYKKQLLNGTEFTVDSTKTPQISFVAAAVGRYSITNILIAVPPIPEDKITKLQNDVSVLNTEMSGYVLSNSTYKTTELTPAYTKNRTINASTGVVSESSNDIWCVTDSITVEAGEKYLLNLMMRFGNGVVAFYKSDDTFVSAINGNTGTAIDTNMYKFTDYVCTVPNNATKMRIGFITAYGADFYQHEIEKILGYDIIGITKPWTGKKWVCVGDSLTEVNIRAEFRYYDYVKKHTGINVVIMGASGSGYARLADQNKAFYQRISDVPTDADVVTIFGSFNDLGAGLDIGTVNDTGTTTLAGCINTTIDNLQTVIPLVNLGIVAPTPWNTTQPTTSGTAYEYVEMLKAICERRSIPFLDLWRCSNLRPWDADFRALAYSKDEGAGTHPDENGHKLIAPRFEGFLNTLLFT